MNMWLTTVTCLIFDCGVDNEEKTVLFPETAGILTFPLVASWDLI